jgi:methylenetetrahydrofolate dehydrogenase (NADP+)/methenyltetrahydrofolate cyclohydrolase
VIETISPAKDVDGFHVASAGALMVGQPGFWPCTPYGCLKMLDSIGYDLAASTRWSSAAATSSASRWP